MEPEVSKTLQTILPIWVVLPGVIAIWIVTQWPRIRDLLRHVIPSQRAFYREKQRLELLKLKYEIEALRQTNNLENLEESTYGGEASITSGGRIEPDSPPTPATEPKSEPFSILDAGRRIGLGAFGGFLVQIYTLAVRGPSSSILALNETFRMYLGWDFVPILIIVVLALLSGTAAFVLTDRDATGFRCFVLGAVAVVVLLGLIPTPQAPPLSLPQPD